MRHKLLIVSVAIIISLSLTTLQAQTMFVRLRSGVQTAYAVSDIRKVTFSGGQMQVQQTSSAITNSTLSELRYVNFVDLIAGLVPGETTSEKLILYPNPVVTELNIDISQIKSEQSTIEIYSLEGKKIYSQNFSHCGGVHSLNVEFLERGIYIYRFQTNNQVLTTKFIKN